MGQPVLHRGAGPRPAGRARAARVSIRHMLAPLVEMLRVPLCGCVGVCVDQRPSCGQYSGVRYLGCVRNPHAVQLTNSCQQNCKYWLVHLCCIFPVLITGVCAQQCTTCAWTLI